MNRDDSLDWTRLTRDPNDGTTRRHVLRELLSRRELHDDRDLIDVVIGRIAGKRVLDVGVVSHTMDYVSKQGWRHALVAERAAYCLGIDILSDEVRRLRADSCNVRVPMRPRRDLGSLRGVHGDVIGTSTASAAARSGAGTSCRGVV
jgi:hypothetical protein